MFNSFQQLITHAVSSAIEKEAKTIAYNAGIQAGYTENKSLYDNPYEPSAPEFLAWKTGLLQGIMNKTVEKKNRK